MLGPSQPKHTCTEMGLYLYLYLHPSIHPSIYHRHEEAGITQPEGSLGSISDADRFVTDVAAVNKNERDASIAKQEQMYYAKRLNNADREEKRWRTIEMEDDMDNQRWASSCKQ